MVQIAASKQELTDWNGFQWRRRIEAFGANDESVAARGPSGEIEGIWYVVTSQQKMNRS